MAFISCVQIFGISAVSVLNCSFLRFYIYLKVYETGRSYGKFCGETLPYIVSESNLLYLRFLSNFEVTGRGFNMSYHYQLDSKYLI